MKKRIAFFAILAMLPFLRPAYGAEDVRATVTVIVASNKGNDFNVTNDAYRDELFKLFSYSSYHQAQEFAVMLPKAARQRFDIEGGYELILTLQGIEKDRVLVQAIIRKENRQYVDTVLSILRPGVVFVGGPRIAGTGELIIVLETGF